MEDEFCTICQEDVQSDGALLDGCIHGFHYDCILAWAKETNRCPNCKATIKLITNKTTFKSFRAKEKEYSHREDHVLETWENLVCYECGHRDRDEDMLLCDRECGRACHYDCDNLPGIPGGAWYCNQCADIPPVPLHLQPSSTDTGVTSGDSMQADASKRDEEIWLEAELGLARRAAFHRERTPAQLRSDGKELIQEMDEALARDSHGTGFKAQKELVPRIVRHIASLRRTADNLGALHGFVQDGFLKRVAQWLYPGKVEVGKEQVRYILLSQINLIAHLCKPDLVRESRVGKAIMYCFCAQNAESRENRKLAKRIIETFASSLNPASVSSSSSILLPRRGRETQSNLGKRRIEHTQEAILKRKTLSQASKPLKLDSVTPTSSNARDVVTTPSSLLPARLAFAQEDPKAVRERMLKQIRGDGSYGMIRPEPKSVEAPSVRIAGRFELGKILGKVKHLVAEQVVRILKRERIAREKFKDIARQSTHEYLRIREASIRARFLAHLHNKTYDANLEDLFVQDSLDANQIETITTLNLLA